jgi:hypothetical protein
MRPYHLCSNLYVLHMVVNVINLNSRPERLSQIREELSKVGMNAKRFEALTGGWKGCRDSHLALLEANKSEPFHIILEDDCVFSNDFNEVIIEAIKELPTDWDCLYLGGSPRKTQERYSDHLFKANNVWTTHSIIWHNRTGGAVEYILSHKDDILKWDVYLSSVIHNLFNCFLVFPLLCDQRETGTSDTCKRSDVSTIKKNYQIFCK